MSVQPQTAQAVMRTRKSPSSTQYRYRREIQAHCNPAEFLALAATTGQVPLCDTDGNPTGEYEAIDAKERISIMTTLLGKLVSPPKPVLAAPGDASMSLAEDVARSSAAAFIEQAERQAQAIPVQPLPVEPASTPPASV